MARSDEYVLEALMTFDKLGVVVHELLAIEAWKEVSGGYTHSLGFAQSPRLKTWTIVTPLSMHHLTATFGCVLIIPGDLYLSLIHI